MLQSNVFSDDDDEDNEDDDGGGGDSDLYRFVSTK